MANSLDNRGIDNEIFVGENVTLVGFIEGNRNRVYFAGSREPSVVHLYLSGDNNIVQFEHAYALKDLNVTIGSHIPAHNTRLKAGYNLSIESGGRILLYTSGGALDVGEHCMFSSDVTMRCGESPHLIFEKESGKFLDVPKGVSIGNHVWVGENSYLTKSASIADECVVGACSVVTRRFEESHCAIAGNPARVVRQGIQWIRNKHYLEAGSKYSESHDEFHTAHAEQSDSTSQSPQLHLHVQNGEPSATPSVLRQLVHTDQKLKQKESEISDLRRQIRDMELSTSWKITAPVRAVKRLMHRFRG
ncbi:acetyltransferase-like isoleucine patch superfamily enzyme [Paraburkholderia sp. GAS41]|uniref:acyltransferase n=1 Tax=Paraburkholderia sp. GAS41 TaxID=3035134 RepID=UPI003D24048E